VLIEPEKLISSAQIVPNNYTFTEIYHIMLAKDLSNPPAADHQDTRTRSLIIINIYCLCLGAFVAILSGLSGLGNGQPTVFLNDRYKPKIRRKYEHQ